VGFCPLAPYAHRVTRALGWIRSELALIAAVVVGAALRLDQIAGQIVADDEWHALMTVRDQTYGFILSHFGWADYSIPLTLYDKALSDTVGLTELGMRAPMLLAGIATLFALPLLVRRELGKPASDGFAWLLAVSPLHVYFSRYARPYAISLLLAVVSVIVIRRWSERPSFRTAALYTACAWLASWLHLTVAPFLVAPLLVLAVQRAALAFGRRPVEGATLLQVVALGALVGCGLLGMLIVPVLDDWASLAVKAGANQIDPESFGPAFELLSGAQTQVLRALFAAGLVAGTVVAIERRNGLLGLLVLCCACLVLALLVSRPELVQVPIVLVRYLLPVLVVLLLATALGLSHLDGWLASKLPWKRGLLACGVPIVLLAFGPLRDVLHHPNQWTNHAWFQYQYSAEARKSYETNVITPSRIPAFYAQLALREPGSLLIVEAPWNYQWVCVEFAVFQRIHRQRMLIGFVYHSPESVRQDELPLGRQYAFRNFAHIGDLDHLRRRGVDFVVLHKHLREELRSPFGNKEPDMALWIAIYKEHCGEPVFDDEDISVFALGTQRAL
jgi:hypothetical protein